MKFEGRWFWCYSCDHAAIQCDFCGNTSCNGGGCEKCHDDFEEVSRMYASGEAPRSRKGLPKRGGGMEVMLKLDPKLSKEEFDIALEKALKEFYAEQDAISGETE